jgi:hypothetical protein
MRQLLVALVATAALVASQNSAEAVFEKTIIDNFTLPGGGSADTSLDNDTEDVSSVSDVATMRTLGVNTGGLTVPVGVGGDRLSISQAAGVVTEIAYTLSNATFLAVDPVVYLTDVIRTSGAGDLIVRMYVNTGMSESLYDTATYSGAAGGSQDLQFVNLGLSGGTYASIRFEFEPTGGNWSGTADNLVANPEPATMALMGLGVLGGAIGYRRRRKDDAVAPVEA